MPTTYEPGEPATPASGRAGGWTLARLARGLTLFVILTACGFWVLSWRGTLGNGLAALRGVRLEALAIGVGMAALDQVVGGLRMWFAARALGERVALRGCVFANSANIFLGGVTPSQSGGGPAQIWLLTRYGLGLTPAAVTSLCSYLGTVCVFLGLAAAVTLGHDVLPVPGILRVFTGTTVVLFGATVVSAAFALAQPVRSNLWIERMLRSIPRWGPRLARSGGVRSFQRLLADTSTLVRRGLRRGKLAFLAVLLLSVALYLNKFLMAYVAVRALGLHAAVDDVVYIMALQTLMIYFAPTPGASGFAEVTAAELMRRVVPEDNLGGFVVLWRTLTLFLGMAAGAVVLVRSGFANLRPSGDERPPDLRRPHAKISASTLRR